MVKLTFFKLILLTTITLSFSSTFWAQDWGDIIPLKSRREDVIKLLKGGQQLPDGSTYYTLEESNITIKYYKEGCSENEMSELKLSTDTVIEIESVPNIELPTAIANRNFYQGQYEKIPLSAERNIYFDFVSNSVVDAKTYQDKPELVNAIFYIPEIIKVPSCLLKNMDLVVQKAFNSSKIVGQVSKDPKFYESSFLRHPALNDLTKEDLDLFADALSKSRNSSGYLIIYAGKKSKIGEVSIWTERLKKYLSDRNKFDEKRLIFINGGYRDTTELTLLVLPNEFGAPQPTPAIPR